MSPKSSVTFTGQGKAPFTGFAVRSIRRAEAGGGEIARDAGDAGAVGAVGRDVDVDHRVVEAGIVGIGRADRRVVRQIDDAVMIVGEAELALGQEHAVDFDAADDADCRA